MKFVWFLSLPLYVIDQISKAMVLRWISTDESVVVIPGVLNLVQVHNTGAAFGMLRDNNVFFVVLATLAIIVLAVLAWRGMFSGPLMKTGAALLAPGIVGNLTDRIFHGHVVDFVDVILPWYGHWPAFNVADSCICAAAALFVIAGFVPENKDAAKTVP
jgi:signal peptidase II